MGWGRGETHSVPERVVSVGLNSASEPGRGQERPVRKCPPTPPLQLSGPDRQRGRQSRGWRTERGGEARAAQPGTEERADRRGLSGQD